MLNDKKSLRLTIILVCAVAVAMLGAITFAYFTVRIEDEGDVNSLKGKAVFTDYKISMSETNTGLNLENTYPMPDEVGLKIDPYTFTVKSEETSRNIGVSIILEVISTSTLSDDLVHVAVEDKVKSLGTDNTKTPSETTYKSAYKIYEFDLAPGESKTYNLRAWINDAGTVDNAQNKVWSARVLVVPNITRADETLQALNLTSGGVRTDFDSPSPLPGEGVTTIVSSTKYKNVTNVTMDPANSYVADADGVYTSQNKDASSTATLTLSPSEEGRYYVCYEASSEESWDIGEIFLDEVSKIQFSGLMTGCVDLGTISSSNNIKVTYSKDRSGSDNDDEIKFYLATEATIGKTPDSDSGIYEMEDDYGTSYYFRGAVENNYVRFGKWAEGTDHVGSDMYWRIVRINGDGSLRMIYAGTSAHLNNEQGEDTLIGTSAFNAKWDDAKYVGYMYGPANEVEGTTTPSTSKEEAQSNIASSDIKKRIDEWYETNLATEYGKYLSDTAFCYDRSTNKGASGWSDDTGLGYGQNITAYGAMNRFVDMSSGSWEKRTGITPTFKCSNKNDRFTKSDYNMGNASLDYPVGLLSADEIVAAGSGGIVTASNYYLKRNSWYWAGSPYYFYNGSAYVFGVNPDYLDDYDVSDEGGVAPVINLTADYSKALKGDGRIGSEPFHL